MNVNSLKAFIEAPLHLQHIVARADGVASGPSMGKTFPDGTPYYVRPITGPLVEGMIVVILPSVDGWAAKDGSSTLL